VGDLFSPAAKAEVAPIAPEPPPVVVATPEPPPTAAPEPAPVMMAKPSALVQTELPVFKPLDNDPLGLFKNPPVVKMPTIDVPAKVEPSLPVVPPPAPAAPHPFSDPEAQAKQLSTMAEGKPEFTPKFDLAGMMKKLDDAESAPKPAPITAKPLLEKISNRDLHAPKANPLHGLRSSLSDLWLKVDILAGKLKVPGFLLVGIVVAVLAGGIAYFLQQSSGPAVTLVDSIPPITILPIDVAQAGDIDIVSFNELQQQLGSLGFSQATQMTVPQLPGPNFFDVGLKEDANTYCEILKMPNQIGCRVSFVTVFTNGVWYSTNGWSGTGQQLEYLVSEFYPEQNPQQLFEQHKQGVQKLQSVNGWEAQRVSLNRYMADLSDHLRWYLVTKKINPFQADFASWH
jgi:hypothetical protein